MLKNKKKMKKLLLLSLLITPLLSNAQWHCKNVNNGIDDPYKICYTTVTDGVFLKLEKSQNEIAFYLSGGYFCDENTSIIMSFLVNGEYKRYSKDVSVYKNSTVFIVDDLLNSEILEDFKACTSFIIRINESFCESETYTFNMSGSTNALNFISN